MAIPARPLIVVPTSMEAEKIEACLRRISRDVDDIEVIGFGPIASAARMAQALSQVSPRTVTLIGIAGLYQTSTTESMGLSVGSACEVGDITCYGVGAGSGEAFRSAEALGWKQTQHTDEAIGDSIRLPIGDPSGSTGIQMLTVCSAAQSPEEIRWRLNFRPDAVGEEMEGFGVAIACAMYRMSCRIIRGFSNIAGDRDHANWQIDDAIEAACKKYIQNRRT
ncbi:MAG: hypothetical protein AAFN77_07545 [Planctomycetota bacterium]